MNKFQIVRFLEFILLQIVACWVFASLAPNLIWWLPLWSIWWGYLSGEEFKLAGDSLRLRTGTGSTEAFRMPLVWSTTDTIPCVGNTAVSGMPE